MRVIVIGAGEIGRHLAMYLSGQHHDAVVIDADKTVAAELEASLDVRVMCADATAPSTLVEAGAAEADLVFALSSDNNVNLVVCAMAKEMGARSTICRVHPTLQRDEILFDFRSQFGVDYLFSPERLSALEIGKWIRNPVSSWVEEIGRGSVELQLVRVAESSSLLATPLAQMKLPERVRIATIKRKGKHFVPASQDCLEVGDHVVMFGDPKRLREVAGLVGPSRFKEGKKVTIFGGGEYGFALAQLLEGWGFSVRIFDASRERCQWLAANLSHTTIINADATHLAELKEEQVGNSDYFVASTGTDEDNVMSCLQAFDLGVDACFTLIHRQDYARVISRAGEVFGIKSAISPREVVRRELMRFLTSDRYHLVRELDGVELIEVSVTKKAAAVGKKIRQIRWPKNTGIVALLRDTRAFVPTADDEICVDDSVFAMVHPGARKEFLKWVRPR